MTIPMQSMANRLSQMMGMGEVIRAEVEPLASEEQGFSGAAMLRMKVMYDGGGQGSFICKKTDLKERMVMETLTLQGHHHTPASCTDDCQNDAPAWMLQQDLGRRVEAPHNDLQWIEKVAQALARIHADNMNRGASMPWLPEADKEYWENVTTKLSVDHFERMVADNKEFAAQFEHVLPGLREAGKNFADDMTAMYQEKQYLTLTHGDLQNLDGDHVYNVNGEPYIIDWGFARYAPFYIDLVDYFSPDHASVYGQALHANGIEIGHKDFEERFRSAYRYPGFIYMFPSIMQWKRGSSERLIRMLKRIGLEV